MILRCSAIIDNPDEMRSFADSIRRLGLKPIVTKNTVSVEYEGYNMVRCGRIIEAFENCKRHSIDTHGV